MGSRTASTRLKNEFGPIDENIFAWSDEQRARIKPAILPERGLAALEADHDFLTEGNVFSEEMINQWVDLTPLRILCRPQQATSV